MINIEFQKYIFDSKINSSGLQNNEVLVFHRRLSKLFKKKSSFRFSFYCSRKILVMALNT